MQKKHNAIANNDSFEKNFDDYSKEVQKKIIELLSNCFNGNEEYVDQ